MVQAIDAGDLVLTVGKLIRTDNEAVSKRAETAAMTTAPIKTAKELPMSGNLGTFGRSYKATR